MDGLQEFINMFGNGFFPIVACAVMFWQNGKLRDTLTEIAKTLVKMNEDIDDLKKSKEVK